MNIGEFSSDHPLRLTPAPNGGWLVEQDATLMGAAPQLLGAYSTTGDMLAALSSALIETEPEPDLSGLDFTEVPDFSVPKEYVYGQTPSPADMAEGERLKREADLWEGSPKLGKKSPE